jgi:Chain length determinant protein
MEIRDYLRAIRRVLWLVIAVPVVAGLLVGGFIELQPSAYQANAQVVVPAITANGISQSAASQYASTFKDVLTSLSVVPVVSQKFGIPQSELVTGLSSSTTTASSNLINVVLVGKKGQNLVGAVREAAVDTMNAIAAPQLVEAGNEVTNSAQLLQDARTAIFNFDAQYGNISPQVAYNALSQTISQENATRQQAQVNGDAAHVASLTALITKNTLILNQLGQQVQAYQPLASALSSAQAASDHANVALVNAKSLIATDSATGTVTTKNVGRISKLADVIKFAAIGFALALIMMLGLILILELMRSGRRRQEPDGIEQGSFAWASPSAETRAAGPPATPAMAATAASAATTRDPWRAAPTTAPTAAEGNGNGNGNGHVANGSGQTPAPDAETEPQRAGGGVFRRR